MAHLIDKDAVIAEIKDRLVVGSGALEIRRQEMQAGKGSKGYYKQSGVLLAYNSIIKFLNTLEVKEVDLEKEYKVFVEEDPVYNKLVNGIVGKAIAKHFFELGLRVNNEKEK